MPEQTVDHWLNPAAFASPAPGKYGNAGRFNLKGPGVFQLDMALSRTFVIREGKLQLRVEAFNLPNHPEYTRGYSQQRKLRTDSERH
ncbi:MAG: hypothetical protein DMG14_35405 [Acidobacteria bacterium]|nr:MAG: hypothetical protein DMG14_35405 [Acidobacteriota bacterium]